MRFPWPPNSPALPSNPFAYGNDTDCSPPRAPPGGTRRYSAEDLNRITRITALVGAGVNIAGILDLEEANTAAPMSSEPPIHDL
jgi:hypothetical protein